MLFCPSYCRRHPSICDRPRSRSFAEDNRKRILRLSKRVHLAPQRSSKRPTRNTQGRCSSRLPERSRWPRQDVQQDLRAFYQPHIVHMPRSSFGVLLRHLNPVKQCHIEARDSLDAGTWLESALRFSAKKCVGHTPRA